MVLQDEICAGLAPRTRKMCWRTKNYMFPRRRAPAMRLRDWPKSRRDASAHTRISNNHKSSSKYYKRIDQTVSRADDTVCGDPTQRPEMCCRTRGARRVQHAPLPFVFTLQAVKREILSYALTDQPPSATIVVPVMRAASSDAKNTTVLAHWRSKAMSMGHGRAGEKLM